MDWGRSVGGNGDGYNQKRNLDNQRDKGINNENIHWFVLLGKEVFFDFFQGEGEPMNW